MRLRHLGHSCLLVEIADRTILIDPGTWSSGFEDLTGLDAIVVTHQHADHLDRARFTALVAANPDATIVTDPQTSALLAEDGLSVTAWDDQGTTQVGDVTLSAHGREHAFNQQRQAEGERSVNARKRKIFLEMFQQQREHVEQRAPTDELRDREPEHEAAWRMGVVGYDHGGQGRDSLAGAVGPIALAAVLIHAEIVSAFG